MKVLPLMDTDTDTDSDSDSLTEIAMTKNELNV